MNAGGSLPGPCWIPLISGCLRRSKYSYRIIIDAAPEPNGVSPENPWQLPCVSRLQQTDRIRPGVELAEPACLIRAMPDSCLIERTTPGRKYPIFVLRNKRRSSTYWQTGRKTAACVLSVHRSRNLPRAPVERIIVAELRAPRGCNDGTRRRRAAFLPRLHG